VTKLGAVTYGPGTVSALLLLFVQTLAIAEEHHLQGYKDRA
jgi:hypothetical protein